MCTEEQKQQALEAFDRLGSTRKAAREITFASKTTITRWVQERECPRVRLDGKRPWSQYDSETKYQAFKLHKQGYSNKEIAVKLGLPREELLRCWLTNSKNKKDATVRKLINTHDTVREAASCFLRNRFNNYNWKTTSCEKWWIF